MSEASKRPIKPINPLPSMKIIRARSLGLCFGVRDAIDLATREAARRPVTILGELVHNDTVLRRLRDSGAQSADTLDQIRTSTVMISAHGTSDRRRRELQDSGLEVLEATCPLVAHAHQSLQTLVREGWHPVVVGRRDHVEVLGLTGDFADFDVILEPSDLDRVRERPRFGVVAQTTQPLPRVQEMVRLLGLRFPRSEVRFVDTVCQPTKQRQTAAADMARSADVVVVIGGFRSNNTRELAALCRRFCPRVHQVETAGDLDPAWLRPTDTVGLTAGTSTPDETVTAVQTWLDRLAHEADHRPDADSGAFERETDARFSTKTDAEKAVDAPAVRL